MGGGGWRVEASIPGAHASGLLPDAPDGASRTRSKIWTTSAKISTRIDDVIRCFRSRVLVLGGCSMVVVLAAWG